MAALIGRVLFHILVPVLAFLFLGVPLETYVRALDGIFSSSQEVGTLINEHLFIEAAAAFYCITVLLEAVVILSRPHMASHSKIPTSRLMIASLVIAMLLTASYVLIRTHRVLADLDPQATKSVLIIAICVTSALAITVHVLDYLSSSEVSPRLNRPKRSKTR